MGMFSRDEDEIPGPGSFAEWAVKRDAEFAGWPVGQSQPVSSTVADVIRILREMPHDAWRKAVFSEFCTVCGATNPHCYCARDTTHTLETLVEALEKQQR